MNDDNLYEDDMETPSLELEEEDDDDLKDFELPDDEDDEIVRPNIFP